MMCNCLRVINNKWLLALNSSATVVTAASAAVYLISSLSCCRLLL